MSVKPRSLETRQEATDWRSDGPTQAAEKRNARVDRIVGLRVSVQPKNGSFTVSYLRSFGHTRGQVDNSETQQAAARLLARLRCFDSATDRISRHIVV